MRKFIKSNRTTTCFTIVVIVGCAASIILPFLKYLFTDLNDGLMITATSLIALATFILAFIVLKQIDLIHKTSQADLLMRIEERLSSDVVSSARALIHKYYLETKTNKSDISQSKHIVLIQEEIKKACKNEMDTNEFKVLLIFLDTLETIAYLCRNGYVLKADVMSLSGGQIDYYYQVFKAWIDIRRERYGNNYYENLIALVNEINKDKSDVV